MTISVAEAHRMCAAGELEALQSTMMRNGNDFSRSIDGEKKTLFFVACENGHLDLARWLYTVIAIEVLHTKDVRGWAPILAACANGHLAVARWLFAEESEACGKELRAPTLPGGWTPMIIACKQGHLAVAQWLLEEVDPSGQTIHARTAHGWAPVWIACTFGQEETLRWLLANGADPTIADHNGHTPLYQATSCGHFHLIPNLILDGAASAERSDFGEGCLDGAVLKRDVFKLEAQVSLRRALVALVQQAESFVGDVLCAAAVWRPLLGGNPWPPHTLTSSSSDRDENYREVGGNSNEAECTRGADENEHAATRTTTPTSTSTTTLSATPRAAAATATNSGGLEAYHGTECILCGDLLVPPLGHALDLIQLLGCRGVTTTHSKVSTQQPQRNEDEEEEATMPSRGDKEAQHECGQRQWGACCPPVHAGCHLVACTAPRRSAAACSLVGAVASVDSPNSVKQASAHASSGDDRGPPCHSCYTSSATVARRYRRRLGSTSSACDVSLVQLPPSLAFSTSDTTPAATVVMMAPCPLSKLCGHESTLLQLVADFAGVVRGRQLRLAQEALESLPN